MSNVSNTPNSPASSPADQLAKSYEPAPIEAHWGPEWESRGIATASLDDGKTDFSVQLPPPNVTGTLHMGHAFNQTIMDGLVRHARMSGKNTLWVPGTDHAGIATQIVVERQLDAQKVSRHDLGREKFLEKVWEWKETYGNTITNQIRRIGASIDRKPPVQPLLAKSVALAPLLTGVVNISRWTTRCPKQSLKYLCVYMSKA